MIERQLLTVAFYDRFDLTRQFIGSPMVQQSLLSNMQQEVILLITSFLNNLSKVQVFKACQGLRFTFWNKIAMLYLRKLKSLFWRWSYFSRGGRCYFMYDDDSSASPGSDVSSAGTEDDGSSSIDYGR